MRFTLPSRPPAPRGTSVGMSPAGKERGPHAAVCFYETTSSWTVAQGAPSPSASTTPPSSARSSSRAPSSRGSASLSRTSSSACLALAHPLCNYPQASMTPARARVRKGQSGGNKDGRTKRQTMCSGRRVECVVRLPWSSSRRRRLKRDEVGCGG